MTWFILPAIGIIFVNVLPSGIGQHNSKFKPRPALILYPQAALDYFGKTNQQPDCECVSEFKTLEQSIRENICLQYLVDAVPFTLSDQTDFVKDNFRTLVKETYETVPNTFIPKILLYNRESSAQWCIRKDGKDEWAVSSGFHQGVVFVYKKKVNTVSSPDYQSHDFKLIGLSEEMPNLHHKLRKQQIESQYVTGDHVRNTLYSEKGEEVEDGKKSKSLCELDEYERIRACATSHLALEYHGQNLHHEDNLDIQHILKDKPACVKGVIAVDFQPTSSPLPLQSFNVDVLSCSIYTRSNRFEFFLTKDPHSVDAVFTVEPSSTERDLTLTKDKHRDSANSIPPMVPSVKKDDLTPSNDESDVRSTRTRFRLKYYMTNLRVLKPFNVRY